MFDANELGYSHCHTAVDDGADPANLFGPGVLGADEALLNAVGIRWVLDAAGVEYPGSADISTLESVWLSFALGWMRAYAIAYEQYARELADPDPI